MDKFEVTDCSRSLRSPEAVVFRREMRREAHMVPLAEFVAKLRRTHPEWEFPDFDPLDGGTYADILFLFEKPGPMTSARGKGSGFISRDNDDRTAEHTFDFMKKAKLPRNRTIIWNVIPGWNGTRRITAAEHRAGVNSLVDDLIPLLPKLRTIVLVGRKAERARQYLNETRIQIFTSAHPSSIVRASQPDIWRKIPSIWAQAGRTLFEGT
jgi:hypothetical protein